MKINEVEALVGITKKNIRFYEDQGLLSPRRDPQNGYRDYGDEDVRVLGRIMLLRKLGVPIDEIRKMQTGAYTVADGMRRHLICLEREQRNLQQSIVLCQQLQSMDVPLGELDADGILKKMQTLEQGGTTFRNGQKQDIRIRYVAPVVVTVLMVALMAGLSGLLVWLYRISPEDAPPVWLLCLCIGMFAAVGCGVLLALWQRIREIGKGEIDDAKRY